MLSYLQKLETPLFYLDHPFANIFCLLRLVSVFVICLFLHLSLLRLLSGLRSPCNRVCLFVNLFVYWFVYLLFVILLLGGLVCFLIFLFDVCAERF